LCQSKEVDDREQVEQLLGRLDKQSRAVLEALIVRDEAQAQVAKDHGITERWCRTLRDRALEALREMIA
jgi:DNA-directed RNA polymerase specialized sigma24 family protein